MIKIASHRIDFTCDSAWSLRRRLNDDMSEQIFNICSIDGQKDISKRSMKYMYQIDDKLEN